VSAADGGDRNAVVAMSQQFVLLYTTIGNRVDIVSTKRCNSDGKKTESRSVKQGPDLLKILRQTYDNLRIMIELKIILK